MLINVKTASLRIPLLVRYPSLHSLTLIRNAVPLRTYRTVQNASKSSTTRPKFIPSSSSSFLSSFNATNLSTVSLRKPSSSPLITRTVLSYPPCIQVCIIRTLTVSSLNTLSLIPLLNSRRMLLVPQASPVSPFLIRSIVTNHARNLHTTPIRFQDYRRRRPTTSYYRSNPLPSSSMGGGSGGGGPFSNTGNNRYLIPIIFLCLLFFSGFGGIFILFLILGIPILFFFGMSMFAARFLSSGVFRPMIMPPFDRARSSLRNQPNGSLHPLFFTWNRWLDTIVKQTLISGLRDERSIRGLVASLQYKVKEEDQLRPWCGRSVTLSPHAQNVVMQRMNVSGGVFGSSMFPMGGNYGINTVQLTLPVKDSHGRLVGALHVQADIQLLSSESSSDTASRRGSTTKASTDLSPVQSAIENIKYYFSGQALKDSRQYSKEMNDKYINNDTTKTGMDWEEEFEKLVQDDTHGKGPLQNEVYGYTIRSVIFQWNDTGKQIDVTHVWPRTLRSDTFPYSSAMFNDNPSFTDTSTTTSNRTTNRSNATTKGRTIDAEWYEKKS